MGVWTVPVLLVSALLVACVVSAGRVTEFSDVEAAQDSVGQLMSSVLGVSDDELAAIVDHLMTTLGNSSKGLCKDNKCSVCMKLPFLKEMCFEIETPEKGKTDVLHLMLTKGGLELICITFPDELPKVCVFHHFCLQVTNIHIAKGKFCACVEFNGRCIIHNRCVHF